MSKSIKWVITIVIIIIIAGVWYFAQKPHVSPPVSNTIKIGVVAPLTGGGAMVGQNAVNAIELAKADLKNAKNNYEIIVEDDQTDPAKSASAVEKLINIDKVNALISVTSGTSNAVAPISEKAGILHIGICSDNKVSDNKTSFIIYVTPENEAKTWVAEAKKRGVTKVAMITMAQAGIDAMAEALKKEAKANGLQIVFAERFNKEVNDFKTTLLKAEQTKPDIYYLVSFPPAIDIVGKQFKELGLKTPLSGDVLDLSKDLKIFEGDWYANSKLADPNFADRLSAKYPNTLFSVRSAPYSYDAFNLLVNAFEKGSTTPADYVANQSSFSGVSGQLTKDADGFFQSEDAVWTIKNSVPVQAN